MSPQQLDDMVAPIALYPDPLLAEVLAATTYPMEIAEAEQWVRDHPSWKPSKLMDRAKKENWDPSVQGLVAFPDVLARLTQSIGWTTQLGNAFLAQQADVMHAVQRMWAQAEAKGTLHSTPQETVTTQNQSASDPLVPEGFARAAWDGATKGGAKLYHGYHFRVLEGQGSSAPGGSAQLLREEQADWRVRPGGLAGRIWSDRDSHVHREPERCSLSKGYCAGSRQAAAADNPLRPRPLLGTGGLADYTFADGVENQLSTAVQVELL
jgi:hypothetical protein